MWCTSCGTQAPSDVRFCPACGAAAPVHPVAPASGGPPPRTPRRRLAVLAVAGLLVAAAAAAGTYLLTAGSTGEDGPQPVTDAGQLLAVLPDALENCEVREGSSDPQSEAIATANCPAGDGPATVQLARFFAYADRSSMEAADAAAVEAFELAVDGGPGCDQGGRSMTNWLENGEVAGQMGCSDGALIWSDRRFLVRGIIFAAEQDPEYNPALLEWWRANHAFATT